MSIRMRYAWLLPCLLLLFVACTSSDEPVEPNDPSEEQPMPEPEPEPEPEQPFTLHNKRMAILGDSYSTYGGWIPSDYLTWYAIDGVDGNNSSKNDVSSVSDTWWHRLMTAYNCTLVINSSYSGSPISYTGYKTDSNPTGDETKTAFITRMKRDLTRSVDVEVIFILGGTNDRYAGAPLGEPQYADWTAESLKQFCPAFCYMLDYLLTEHPQARVINIMNDCFTTEWQTRIAEMTAHYGVQNIALTNIKGSANLQGGHPTRATMQRIAEQVAAAVEGQEK